MKMYVLKYSSKTIFQYALTEAYGITFSQPFQSTTYKKAVVYLNTWSGAATYTFPMAFSHTPQILSQSLTDKVTAVSTTAITITGASDTGFIELSGF